MASPCLRRLLLRSFEGCLALPACPESQQRLDVIVRKAAQRRLAAGARRSSGVAAAAGSGGSGSSISSSMATATGAVAHGAYTTLAEPHSSLTEVKKSKFIAHAWPCSSAEEAAQLIASKRDPAASHNCWAFKVGQQYRSSDDGEPGGTAGRPILSAIEGEGLEGVAVLVVRFFGGVKLGAGGLVRAYGGAARDCLRGAPRRAVTPRTRLRLEVPYELLGAVYPLLDQFGAAREAEEYDATAGVALLVGLEAGKATGLAEAVADATSGRVAAQPVLGHAAGAAGGAAE